LAAKSGRRKVEAIRSGAPQDGEAEAADNEHTANQRQEPRPAVRVKVVPMTDVTRILTAIQEGKAQAATDLLPLVYDQLRRMAQQAMTEERPDHTLQATALVHEAYLKLVGDQDLKWANRAHFFAAAAEAMRRILVDEARKRGRIKRGGDRERVSIKLVDPAAEQDSTKILALDEVLQRLEKEDGRLFQVVMLRFFAGLSVEETAQAMSLSPRTVKREWTYARAWLYRAIQAGES
jgi:RNA polymerase sigma factor (TIGR02999 family)